MPRVSENLEEVVLHNEKVSRYVTKSRHVRNDGTVRYQALCPNERDYKTSVFRILELTEGEVWETGNEYVGTDERPVIARMDVLAKYIYDQGLDFEPDNTPPGHANIINWPSDRSRYRSYAQQIAARVPARDSIVR